MKTLYLLRHAHAARRMDLQDFDRPLSPDGLDTANLVAEIMRAEHLFPGQVLCSGARRARQTWEALAAHTSEARRISFDLRDDLYLASHARLLTALRGLPDASNAVLIIAHNPGLHRLAGSLAGPASSEAAVMALSRGYPPAALAVLGFATERWAELGPASGRLERFLLPAPAGPANPRPANA